MNALRMPDAPLRGDFADALPAARRDRALARWDAHASRLFAALRRTYADAPALDDALSMLVEGMAACTAARSDALCDLDLARERDPRWFLAADRLGYSAYVDRFGGSLRGVAERVPYLQRLGVRYLHLLPFLCPREGDSDGGFAVRDYDRVDPALGDDADLDALTARLRDAGISLCADLVLNHTADDHRWALAARAGNARHRDYYHVFPDRTLPDAHERTLGQVFPLTAPGNFTEVPGLGHVWTTFYPYQWDLNWSNPRVFAEMALTLLRLANRGIEAFRMDSTAYLWKRLGTDSMNQPEAHALIQALRAVVDIVAPGVLLKAEAIVPAPALVPYFGSGDDAGHECHLAYHSTLMASLWAALAERRADPLRTAFARTPALPDGCGWLAYLRCHDDIGWNVLREEAEGSEDSEDSEGSTIHARFDLARIARFYAGAEPGSDARGRGFQNAGDDIVHGTNGMTAALCGLDAARERGDDAALASAEARFLLLHGLMLAAPGLPTLYMGDEIALGNDERYADDPLRAGEGRWLHRPAMDWATAEAVERIALDGGATHDSASRIGIALRRMLAVRAAEPAFRGDAATRVVGFDDPAVLGLLRGDDVMVLANLSHRDVTVVPQADAALPLAGWRDLLAGDGAPHALPATLAPHALRWLRRIDTSAARA